MMIRTPAEIDFGLGDLELHALPRRVMMVTPLHYQVEYVINRHMAGNVGSVDPSKATRQWSNLRSAYADLGFEVVTVTGASGFPDMVFCANQTLPGLDARRARKVVLSRMASPERAGEVTQLGSVLSDEEYQVVTLETDGKLEGCGDALWHHDIRLLWCGYGFRSDPETLQEACDAFNVTGVLLELTDDAFYHLDTCLSILDRSTALWVPSAFSPESVDIIEELVPTLIEVPREEAAVLLASNAHCPDGRHVLIQTGCDITASRLIENGFKVIEIDTSEFLKSGGSVFCMKQMLW